MTSVDLFHAHWADIRLLVGCLLAAWFCRPVAIAWLASRTVRTTQKETGRARF